VSRLDGLSENGRTLYEAVPADGSKITTKALRAALGWTAPADDRRFFAARNAVEDAGLIARCEDRAGSVRRIPIVFRQPTESGSSTRPSKRNGGRRGTKVRSLRSLGNLIDDIIDP
jgi:hypothetical protein